MYYEARIFCVFSRFHATHIAKNSWNTQKFPPSCMGAASPIWAVSPRTRCKRNICHFGGRVYWILASMQLVAVLPIFDLDITQKYVLAFMPREIHTTWLIFTKMVSATIPTPSVSPTLGLGVAMTHYLGDISMVRDGMAWSSMTPSEVQGCHDMSNSNSSNIGQETNIGATPCAGCHPITSSSTTAERCQHITAHRQHVGTIPLCS